MARKLVVVATAGFAVAIAAALVALSLGGPRYGFSGFNFPAFSIQGIRIDGSTVNLSLPSGASCSDPGSNATIVTRHLAWSDTSDKVSLSLAADASWAPRAGNDVIITGPSAALDRIKIDGNDIKSDCWGGGDSKITITLPGRVFQSYEMNGVGSLHLKGLNQPELDLDVEGAASVDASGVVPQTHVTVAGAASVNLTDLVTQSLAADLSGASKVVANPAQSADVDISGIGQVSLLTRPKNYHENISGLGHVSMPGQAATDE